jgi:outer membrane cobalamin receptor
MSRRELGVSLLLSALVAPAGPAGSQPPGGSSGPVIHTLEPVVVTASREPQPSDLIPASVSSVSREEMESQRDPNVIEALRRVPGVYVGQPGARGSRSSIYLRGLDPNHTVVLIDGVRVNDPTNNRGGSFDLSTLGVENVDRVEIVRGPLSAVHGSDAIAGAINVITRRAEGEREIELDVSGGRFGYYRAVGAVRGSFGPANLSLTGSYVDEGDPVEGSEFREGSVKAAGGIALPGSAELRGTLRYAGAHAEAFPDDSGGPKFALLRETEEREIRELSAGLELLQAPSPWFDYSLKANFYRRSERRDSPGIAPGLRDPFGIPADSARDVLRRTTLALRNTARLTDGLSVSIGGDAVWEDGESDSELDFGGVPVPAGFGLRRLTGGVFLEGLWSCGCGLVLQAAVRGDFPDDASAEVTPRVGASYRIPGTPAEIRANWGRGFKLPSFFALANPIVGNPDLRPEKSNGFDVGVHYSLWQERIGARLTYFDISVEDLVDFEPGPPPRLVNRSRMTSRGVELELEMKPLSSLTLDGYVTYDEAELRGSSEQLLNRPRWWGGFTLVWRPLARLTFGLHARFVGKVFDSSIPTGRVELQPYARVDAAASWEARDRLTVYLAVDNLFDADYEEAVGFPAVGIRPRIGLEMSW